MLYSAMLMAHSWIRWVVLLAAIVAVARALRAWGGQRAWTSADERAGRVFTTALDLQMLIGLLLYFLFSPFMETVRAHIATAMRDDAMRFWLIEHPFGMLLAVVLAHVGRVRIKKAADARRKHRLTAIFYGLALVAAAGSVPWPGTATGRPLWRMTSGTDHRDDRPSSTAPDQRLPTSSGDGDVSRASIAERL